MSTSIKRVGIVNKNLENINTTAYKQINPDSAAFSDVLQDLFRDDEEGPMVTTNQKLDLALSKSNAYFLVEGENGPERTRNGDFHINRNGNIVNAEGKELVVLKLDGEALNLHLTEDFEIKQNGELHVQGKLRGNIAIDYDNKQPGEEAYLLQGKLEASNVNMIENTMHLVQAKRHIDTLQNMMVMDLSGEKDLIERYGRNV